ncbi:inositol monophosphatase [Lactarius akahatsu]|uniref:Inositol-1-monophosphatase n=1 Tax=Lactarius akahatsu TaxID=416441 RepID=A0AAD4LGZ2_9AGAM|nr:inositol monophosphatase [Lactarius akahatsu]
MLSPTELQEILAFTTELARKAGALILEGSHAIQRAGAGSVGEKKNAVDLVTEYDVKVEELVHREIAGAYPHFEFIGEESYSAGTRPPLTDAPTFCVDPIDGTTNFVHGFPYACISLGLIDQRAPVLGVIYNPFLDHLYTGVRGAGAFLHTRTQPQPQRLPLAPAAARPLPSLGGALIAVEWGSDRTQGAISAKAQSFARLAGAPPHGVMAHSLRSVGSAALNFALVAQGALDAYWLVSIAARACRPWDVCAGIVIAQEAGGFVTGSKAVPHDGVVTEAILTGRRYLVIRGVAGTPEESSLDVQKRLAREFYDTVEDIPLDE